MRTRSTVDAVRVAQRELVVEGGQDVGDVEVPVAVVVDVRDVHPHAGAGVVPHAGARVDDVGEGTVAAVLPQEVEPAVRALRRAVRVVALGQRVGPLRDVLDVHVGPQVVVEVTRDERQAGPQVVRDRAVGQAGLGGGVGERAVAVVAVEQVLVGELSAVADRPLRHVQVHAAVAVVVEPAARARPQRLARRPISRYGDALNSISVRASLPTGPPGCLGLASDARPSPNPASGGNA